MRIYTVAAAAAEAKQTLPEPEVSSVVDMEKGDITVTAVFRNVDPELFQKSKKTLVFSRLAEPASVKFANENGEEQVLAIDELGRQPLQVRISLTAPHIEEKAATAETSTSTTEDENTNGGDPEDEE